MTITDNFKAVLVFKETQKIINLAGVGVHDLSKSNKIIMCTVMPQISHEMSLVVRKPVFGVSDQVRHKPGCTITEDG